MGNQNEHHRREGKYLTFRLGGEEYGLGILTVKEIIGMMPVTPLPQAPAHLKGVINLRGKVIPVVDLRTKFAMPVAETTERTCIIVVETSAVAGRKQETGIVVDAVSDVLYIKEENIEPAPEFSASVAGARGAILGMAKEGSGVKILLDIDMALADDCDNVLVAEAA